MKKAVFLDRDGVLNKSAPPHDYVKTLAEFSWNKHAIELVKEIKKRELLAIVVSNQRGISRGMMSMKFVENLHAFMNDDLKQQGTIIDAFYVCPHGDGCECRKPKPGMLLSAAKQFDVNLSESILIGDSETDKQAADAAGCRASILIESDSVDVGYIMSEIDRLLDI
jgi:D-glycero-D-manno-heptose 1,7-bisphosphate phosphatase